LEFCFTSGPGGFCPPPLEFCFTSGPGVVFLVVAPAVFDPPAGPFFADAGF